MINILHIWYSGGIGGTETYILNLIKNSNRLLFVHTVCFIVAGGEISQELKAHGVKVIELNFKNLYSFSAIIKLAIIIKRHKIDIIHNHVATPIVAILGKIYKKKIIYTEHGNVIVNESNVLLHHFLNFIMSVFLDRVIAISWHVKNCLIEKRKFKKDKVTVIYHGTPINKYKPNCPRYLSENIEDTIYIGAVGRFIKQKGFDYVIDVATAVRHKFKSKTIKFVLVGDGPEMKNLKARVRKLHMDNQILFLGYRREVNQLLKKFHIQLITSINEPFGIVAIEGMAASLPIIAFDIDGINEIICDSQTGFLIKAFDVQAMAQKIVLLVNDEKTRREMGNNGFRHFIKYFNVDQMVSKTEEIYVETISNSRSFQ